MARTLQVQGLVSNGVSIGGTSMLGFSPAYKDVIVSQAEGAAGAEDVDRTGLSAGVTLTCGDVTKAVALLAAALGDTEFSVKESGLATVHDYKITNATDGTIVWTGMRLAIPKVGHGTLSVDGRIRFAAGSKRWSDIMALTPAQEASATTYPSRLMRVHNYSFDPTGTAEAITLSQMAGIELSLAAQNVEEEYDDDDVAVTSVDRGPWAPLNVTISHGDASAVAPSHKNAALLGAIEGVLTCDIQGAGGGTTQVLTINNLLWTGAPQDEKAGYTEFKLAGLCGWRKGAVVYDLTSVPTLFAFTDKP